ncbi:tetratricopeptide repeat protein [Salipaludibacillus sp. LMS25]|jgi:predicted Zn-dependent protease|uniref:tetratricopeptide repeat protein n=1 Tax=Salipaludibacillus sp. LMS25 TaxID=2924031 RepID=UPI0020D1709F|nr:tetratricopeptide repeat protein [Salipaludibacillus sp. LMS25]UTR15979.1 tetratricopeptide repeat protein [Salipaludibacillus sp. LMS25]
MSKVKEWGHTYMPEIETRAKKGRVIPFIQDGGYFYKKGIEAYQNKQIEKAIVHFERAIRLDPEEPVFMCQLAIVLSEQGNYDRSNEWLHKIKYDVAPDMSECYFFMANNLAHLGEFEEAKENLEDYLKMDEDGEFADDAESLLDMIEKQENTNREQLPEQQKMYGEFKLIALLNCGDFSEAEQEARKLIGEEPDNWNMYVYLAEALIYQNEWHDAENILKNLLLKEEPNFLAQCLMAVLLHLKREPEACTWVKNLVNLRPIDAWDCHYLARVLSMTGEYKNAFAWYDKLLGDYSLPKLPHITHQMAVLAWHCGDLQTAKHIWEDIRQEDVKKQGLMTYLLSELEKGNKPSHDRKQFLYR